MEEIRLTRDEWWFDPQPPLSPAGGFGQVFQGGRGDGDRSVAVKQLQVSAEDAAHPECTRKTLGDPTQFPRHDPGGDVTWSESTSY